MYFYAVKWLRLCTDQCESRLAAPHKQGIEKRELIVYKNSSMRKGNMYTEVYEKYVYRSSMPKETSTVYAGVCLEDNRPIFSWNE